MRWPVLALLVFLPVLASADDNAGDWSKPYYELRGRLVIPADQKRDAGDPIVRVYLELQNLTTSLSDKKIRYTRGALSVQVTDESGKKLPENVSLDNGMVMDHEDLLMPLDSTLRFRINGDGMYFPHGTRQAIDFMSHCWVIPASDGHSYFLSATLTLPQKSGDYDPRMNWYGVLKLPRVAIPRD